MGLPLAIPVPIAMYLWDCSYCASVCMYVCVYVSMCNYMVRMYVDICMYVHNMLLYCNMHRAVKLASKSLNWRSMNLLKIMHTVAYT